MRASACGDRRKTAEPGLRESRIGSAEADGWRLRRAETDCDSTRQARERSREMTSKKKLFEYGGIAASIILVAFGIAAIVLGINGRSTVHNNLSQEAIVGTPRMTRSAITAEASQAKLPSSISRAASNVGGGTIATGFEAGVFAHWWRS